jgi:hypothetical protein
MSGDAATDVENARRLVDVNSQQPTQYLFTQRDQDHYAHRFWGFPDRLVIEGTWSHLWRSPGGMRGGGRITSVLPVLGLHAHLKTGDWTEPFRLSHRRIAALSGVNKDTVGEAIRKLQDLGFLRRDSRSLGRHLGGLVFEYRLHADLFRREEERFTMLPGTLFYGGTWAVLPTAAARQLYVVLAALDPVKSKDSYWWSLEGAEHGGVEDPDAELLKRRSTSKASLKDLSELSGLSRNSVIEARRILTTPIFGRGVARSLPLFRRGSFGTPPYWYERTAEALEWQYTPEALNEPRKIAQLRETVWPDVGVTRRPGRSLRIME